jgi:hypothetical protein
MDCSSIFGGRTKKAKFDPIIEHLMSIKHYSKMFKFDKIKQLEIDTPYCEVNFYKDDNDVIYAGLWIQVYMSDNEKVCDYVLLEKRQEQHYDIKRLVAASFAFCGTLTLLTKNYWISLGLLIPSLYFINKLRNESNYIDMDKFTKEFANEVTRY